MFGSAVPPISEQLKRHSVDGTDMKSRLLIESRYGPLGNGGQSLTINGKLYSTSDVLAQIGLGFDDTRPIDVLAIAEERYVVRYYDGQDQRVVAQEFDSNFHCLTEARAYLEEWSDGPADFSSFSAH
jgi:hypothetical protein